MKKLNLLFSILCIVVLAGCTLNINVSKESSENDRPLMEEENFESISAEIEAQVKEEGRLKFRNVFLQRIFYSPKYEAYLFGYTIENDTASPTCALEGEVVHNDSFIVKNYTTQQTIFRKTK